jgi:copper chaperone CopZ
VDQAERSAELTSIEPHLDSEVLSAGRRSPPSSMPAQPAIAPAPAPKPAPVAQEPHGCGCGMAPGASCNGSCGGQCGGEAPPLVAPANAAWTTLAVTGMHCGGCARRIERALASVTGVLGVQADFAQGQVRVATASGVDARHLVQPTIDGLGYHVSGR